MGRRTTSEEVFKITADAQLAELNQVVDRLGDVEGAIRDLDDAGQSAGSGADSAGGGIDRMMSIATAAVPVMIGLGAAMTAIGGAADLVGGILDANAATNLLEAQTGLTGDALAELVDVGDDIFKGNWGDSLDDVHDAMQRVRNITGAEGEELEAATTHALAFNQIFGSDITESIRAADTAMEAFGIDGERAFDVLARGFQLTGDPAGDLLDTFNEYGVNFAELGLTADQTLRLLDSGLEGGARNTDDIADAMREFKIRLFDTEGGVEDFISAFPDDFEDFGFFSDLEGGFADGADAIQVTLDAIRDLDDEAARALGVAVFGTRFEDMGLEAFRAMSLAGGSIEDLEGTMGRAEDAVSRGIGPAFESLKRTLGIEFTRALEPTIVDLTEKLIPAIEDFGDWIETDGAPALRNLIGLFSGLGGTASFAVNLGGDIFDQARTEGIGNTLLAGIGNAVDAAGPFIADTLLPALEGGKNEALAAAGSFISDTLAPAVLAELANKDNWTTASNLSRDIISFAADSALDISEDVGTFAFDKIIKPIALELVDLENWTAAAGVLGVVVDAIQGEQAALAEDALDFIGEKIVDPMIAEITDAENWTVLAGLAGDILSAAGGEAEEGVDFAGDWVDSNIIKPIIGAVNDPEALAEDFAGFGASVLSAIGAGLGLGGEEGEGLSVGAGFGEAVLDSLAGTLPTGEELVVWATSTFIDPIIGSFSGLANAVKGAINDAIPPSAGFDVSIHIPGDPFGLFDERTISVGATINLPDPFTIDEAMAGGGTFGPGQRLLVGERGPELLNTGSTSGSVIPNSALGGGDIIVELDGERVGRLLDKRRADRG